MAAPRSVRLTLVSVVAGAALVAVVALLARGGLNAPVLPKTAERPAPHAVRCFDADGSESSTWSADADATAEIPRVDPVAVCEAMFRDAAAVAQLDRIATEQQAIGRDCVDFDTADGGRWLLTGLVSSPDKTYSVSGGPAPGRLPSFGEVSQPAPLASLAPGPTAAPGCVQLPSMEWDLAMPPLVACTGDDITVSVYQRTGRQTARTLCSAKGLVVAATTP